MLSAVEQNACLSEFEGVQTTFEIAGLNLTKDGSLLLVKEKTGPVRLYCPGQEAFCGLFEVNLYADVDGNSTVKVGTPQNELIP